MKLHLTGLSLCSLQGPSRHIWTPWWPCRRWPAVSAWSSWLWWLSWFITCANPTLCSTSEFCLQRTDSVSSVFKASVNDQEKDKQQVGVFLIPKTKKKWWRWCCVVQGFYIFHLRNYSSCSWSCFGVCLVMIQGIRVGDPFTEAGRWITKVYTFILVNSEHVIFLLPRKGFQGEYSGRFLQNKNIYCFVLLTDVSIKHCIMCMRFHFTQWHEQSRTSFLLPKPQRPLTPPLCLLSLDQ